MALQPGDKFGPYELISPIGRGGMGDVWKARDTCLDRSVAMKFSQEKFSERFEREAKAISSLNHPNICTLYDVGPNYLVMEYIEGAPLKGPLSIDQALKYAAGPGCSHPSGLAFSKMTNTPLALARGVFAVRTVARRGNGPACQTRMFEGERRVSCPFGHSNRVW
jgi:serine/threonine protein kinase